MQLKLMQPSPALIVACIALVIALGPAVRAANTVGSDDIIDESILSQDIKDGEVTSSEIASLAVTHTKLSSDSVDSTNVVDDSLTSADLKGVDVSGLFNVAAGIAKGKCHNINVTVAGAEVGEVVVLSVKGAAPVGMLIQATSVVNPSVVTVKACNLTSRASKAINNLPVRVMTFG